jgi:hypothetical protein
MSIAPTLPESSAFLRNIGYACAQREVPMAANMNQTVVKYGVGFGSALAMSVSFALNKSIFWAIIHGILGWIYVVYAWLFKSY